LVNSADRPGPLFRTKDKLLRFTINLKRSLINSLKLAKNVELRFRLYLIRLVKDNLIRQCYVITTLLIRQAKDLNIKY
jgi:hypothetical protein